MMIHFHEQSATTWAYTNNGIYDGPNGKMNTYIQQYYGVNTKFTEAWDFVQSKVMFMHFEVCSYTISHIISSEIISFMTTLSFLCLSDLVLVYFGLLKLRALIIVEEAILCPYARLPCN